MLSDEIPVVGNVELEVPSLGKIKGLSYDDQTCQYLGIQYGEVPGRFRRPKPSAPWKDGCYDGTKLGPYCPQPPRDFYPIPAAARPWLEMPGTDEFNCLNLNISVPHMPKSNPELLPVMVFLHGGAFAYATGSAPIYDGRILATTAATDLARPTIIITLNYRLGVYGFLGGRDIEAYNKEHGESGVGNYGIWDQALALQWIQKHISGFGGDPQRVTLFGQSAGGVSRVKQFLSADVEKVTAAMVPTFVIPVVTMSLCDDGVLIPGPMPTAGEYEQFSIPKWCPNVMMVFRCIIWNKSWDTMSPTPMSKSADLSTPTATGLLQKLDTFLGPEKAKAIAEIYKITPTMSDQETFNTIERFTTHGMYSIPHYFAEQSAPNVYAWHFDVPSPYDNAWGGMAHHSFDNVLIWGVLKHTLPAAHQRISELMQEKWVKFAHGEAPWQRFGEEKKWMVFKEHGAQMMSKEEDVGRGYEEWDRLHELGLVADFADLSDEICLRRKDVLTLDSQAVLGRAVESSSVEKPGWGIL
ncbi:Para-nitrobenzyl esterase [Lachnellula willkommii]|uniref:Carboxylic ester hydrolase n=1 Tax=Lachnellula willkommii TaxID=215461 RepID=A0A559MI37_9HELO|nr:Para-nitrobenzyl esterase [Lachnellula willkommii]